jgi:chromosome segregation ATPase
MTKQPSQTPREQRADLLEAIRVNESLLQEQQAHVAMHSTRLESLDWQLESIRQKVDRQHKLKEEAPGRIVAITSKLETQRAELLALEEEQVKAKQSSRVGMKQLCELLGLLMANPKTVDRGRELLKGINAGVLSHEELWLKYSGGQ